MKRVFVKPSVGWKGLVMRPQKCHLTADSKTWAARSGVTKQSLCKSALPLLAMSPVYSAIQPLKTHTQIQVLSETEEIYWEGTSERFFFL